MEQKTIDLLWKLYAEIRKESLEATRTRTQVIGFKITFVSTGIGVIIANLSNINPQINLILFFIPAFAAVFFDLLIISYSIKISRIGLYCRENLEKEFKNISKQTQNFVFGEHFLQENEVRTGLAIIANLGITGLAIVPTIYATFVPFRLNYLIIFLILIILFFNEFFAFQIPGKIAENAYKKRPSRIEPLVKLI